MRERSRLLPFLIDPLPNTLEDHPLHSADASERLREQAVRWVLFIEEPWSWRGRAWTEVTVGAGR